ncbi:MAG TPA: DUF6777 domain-containing protein [Acidimicrobiia bacterium]
MSVTPPPQPPGPPPSGPPSAPPPPPSGTPRRTLGWKALAIPAIAIVVILGIVVAVLALSGGEEASAETVTLEPTSSAGNNPFAPSVGTDEANVTPPPSSGGSFSGNLEGLYGGTLNVSSCDPQKLVTFLQANPDKGRAWAATLGITFEKIPEYVSGLTPVILRSDTYVTNHGFTNGVANPIPAILQAGTAVLVDKYGTPVTKCYCGNPLTPPTRCSQCTYTGPKWGGFTPGGITIINSSTTIIDIFVLVDPKTGEPFTRPPGTTGGSDTPGTTGTTTTAPTTPTTLAPATAPPTAPPGPSPEEQALAKVQQASQQCYPFPAPIEDSTGASTSTTPAGSYFVLEVVTDTTSGGHQTFVWHVDYATLAFSPQNDLAQVASNHCPLLN